MTYSEAWNLPVEVRHWWMRRQRKENEKKNSKNAPNGHVDPFGGKHGG